MSKNIVEDCEYSNKKMGRSGDPFLYALLLKFGFRNLPKALMPNIQIDVGQIKMRAIDFFSSPPLLRLLNHGEIIYFLTNNYAIYWKDQELASSFYSKCPTLVQNWQLKSRASKSPIVNISYYNIFE